MRATIVSVISVLLLAACDTAPSEESIALAMDRDSELCRRAVADQLSNEQASLRMRSDMQMIAYDQRYHFCMVEKGYLPPPSGVGRTVMSPK